MVADLTSTARVKRALGIPSSVNLHDDYIDDLVAAVDHEVLAYTGQVALTLTSRSDSFDVPLAGQTDVALRGFPVPSVASVSNAGTTLQTSDYYCDERTGMLRLVAAGATWEQGQQTVEVSYTVGHASGSPALATIAHAATIIACARFNATRHAGLKSEGMAGYRYTVDTEGIPAPAVAMLAPFVRIIPRDTA